MKMSDILKYADKPGLYENGTAEMWTDNYISKQLLQIHLNPDIDLASRKKTTIKNTVEWILKKSPGEKMNILDLGCGPGLYSELLCEAGHYVTGIDISKNSIEYARKETERKKLGIEYLCGSYLDFKFGENKYDLVIMIYTDFGALKPADRDKLIMKISGTLKPGGIMIFDIINDTNIKEKITPSGWDISENGFWRDNIYLALSRSFYYAENKVMLNQHIIADDDEVCVYRFWTHFFSNDDLPGIFENTPFDDLQFFTDVLPADGIWNGDNITFCRAVNKK